MKYETYRSGSTWEPFDHVRDYDCQETFATVEEMMVPIKKFLKPGEYATFYPHGDGFVIVSATYERQRCFRIYDIPSGRLGGELLAACHKEVNKVY